MHAYRGVDLKSRGLSAGISGEGTDVSHQTLADHHTHHHISYHHHHILSFYPLVMLIHCIFNDLSISVVLSPSAMWLSMLALNLHSSTIIIVPYILAMYLSILDLILCTISI